MLAFFIKAKGEKLAIVLVYVDDLIITRDYEEEIFQTKVVSSISNERTWITQAFSWYRGSSYSRRNISPSIKVFQRFVKEVWNA